MKQLIDKLKTEHRLTKEEWITLIENRTPELADYLFVQAREIRHKYYGRDVYIRGLIEFTNYCKNDCFYCGIRKSNGNIPRYRLDEDTILSCCRSGYDMGFRTFVLQGGEDGYYTDERMTHLIHRIKTSFPDCAITLSIGEKPYDSYLEYYNAVQIAIVRHETLMKPITAHSTPPQLSASNLPTMSVELKRNRLPDRNRLHGRFTSSNRGCIGGGYAVH